MTIITATTDQSVRFTAFDSDGAAVTLTSASAALAVYYQRWLKGVRLSETQVTPITDLASVGAAHSDGGIIHDADGSHRLDLPDAAFVAGCDEVRLRITATDITGGIAHERFTVGAAAASQASVDAVAGTGGTIDGHTTLGALRLMLAAVTGKLSGANGTEVVIRAADDSKTRITATVDQYGNRSAVTLDDT